MISNNAFYFVTVARGRETASKFEQADVLNGLVAEMLIDARASVRAFVRPRISQPLSCLISRVARVVIAVTCRIVRHTREVEGPKQCCPGFDGCRPQCPRPPLKYVVSVCVAVPVTC